jgi:hypothetical protein|tara:strand:- start:1016 stop:1792 length:777 start_codon:yes stop_codon:yes gene_type:complete
MAHISINKQYIVAGESFILTLDDYQGEIGTQHTYAISGTGITAADHFVGEAALTGTLTIGASKSITKEFSTTSTFPTGENFIPVTIALTSTTSNNITLKVYSSNHFTRVENSDKVDLGDTFDQWRKKTNGFIARLDTLENNVYQYKKQTFTADGTTSSYHLNFDIDNELAVWFDVHIDGISQNSSSAYTINKDNNSILFTSVPPAGASINVVHKADITMTSFDLTDDLLESGYTTRQIQLVNTDNTISEGFVFFKPAE